MTFLGGAGDVRHGGETQHSELSTHIGRQSGQMTESTCYFRSWTQFFPCWAKELLLLGELLFCSGSNYRSLSGAEKGGPWAWAGWVRMKQKKAKQLLEIRHTEVLLAPRRERRWEAGDGSVTQRRSAETMGHGDTAQAGPHGRQPDRKPCWSVGATAIRNSEVCLTVNLLSALSCS